MVSDILKSRAICRKLISATNRQLLNYRDRGQIYDRFLASETSDLNRMWAKY